MRHDFSRKAAAVILAATLAVSGYTGAGYVLAQETEAEITPAAVEAGADEAAVTEQTAAETAAETETGTETAAETTEEETAEEETEEETAEEETAEEETAEEETEGLTEETTEGTTEEITEGTTSEEETEETTDVTEEISEETTEDASEETTEEASYKTDFTFENDEVTIVAKVSAEAQLPENAELHVEKLLPGSEKFEEAKQASIRDLGTAEDADYNFYDVEFYADGEKIEVADGLASVQMTFKNVNASGEMGAEMALHIEEAESGVVARDVTAATEAGSSVGSVEFQF